jgi:hypothetical protein
MKLRGLAAWLILPCAVASSAEETVTTSSDPCPAGQGRLVISVFDEQDAVVAGAEVRLRPSSDKKLLRTDVNGRLSTCSRPGSVRVVVELAGLNTYKGHIAVRAGTLAEARITLRMPLCGERPIVVCESGPVPPPAIGYKWCFDDVARSYCR